MENRNSNDSGLWIGILIAFLLGVILLGKFFIWPALVTWAVNTWNSLLAFLLSLAKLTIIVIVIILVIFIAISLLKKSSKT